MDSTSAKRFVKSLRYAEEVIVSDAKCFCYTHEPEYQEIHEDIKLMIRLMEDGETVAAGKLMYKNARQISPTAAYVLAEKAKAGEERKFYKFIGDMNSQRQGRRTMEENKPVIQPIYNRASNIQRKMEVVLRYIAELNRMLCYYEWVFTNDPWFADRLQEAKTLYGDLEQALREEIEGVGPVDVMTDEKIEAITKFLMEKYKDAWIELAKGPEG